MCGLTLQTKGVFTLVVWFSWYFWSGNKKKENVTF